MHPTYLSVTNKILIGAIRLEERDETPFSHTQLTLAVWQQFPEAFGMEGVEELHPDTNKVTAAVVGRRGLVALGLLTKTAPKTYCLTPVGRNRAYMTAEEVGIPLRPKRALPPEPRASKEQDEFLTAVLDSPAVELSRFDRFHEISFAKACDFWGLLKLTDPNEVRKAIVNFSIQLENTRTAVLACRGLVLSNGRSVSHEDMQLLSDLSDRLLTRFRPHLKLLRARDEVTNGNGALHHDHSTNLQPNTEQHSGRSVRRG